ncbi:MAG: hypothetical protein AAFQ87_20760 [Bacteroidota bacterium]
MSKSQKKRQSKRAAKQATEFSNQWQGANENTPESNEEAFGEGEITEAEMEELLQETDSASIVLSQEELRKQKLQSLRQARKKLEKKSDTYARDLARIDLQERYWEAEDIREPIADGKLVFTFQTPRGPRMLIYDENGEWLGSVCLLNHNQVPVGARKLAKRLEMDVLQFEHKFQIEMRDLRRPVYALYTAQKGLVLDTALQNDQGIIESNVLGGVDVYGLGKHFTYGRHLQQIGPDDLSFVGLVITADGNQVAEKDISKLLSEELFLFPATYQVNRASWTAPIGWQGEKGWYALPSWEPEQNRWYPNPDWYVDTAW